MKDMNKRRYARGLVTILSGGFIMVLSVPFVFEYSLYFILPIVVGFIIALTGLWLSLTYEVQDGQDTKT